MNTRRLTGEAITYGLGRAIEGAAAFIILPFAGRILGPAQYGVSDIITATTSLLFLVIGLNLTQALTRYFYDFDSAVLAATHLVAILVNAAVVVGAGFIALYVFRDRLTHHVAWVAALLVIPLHVLTEHVTTVFRLRHEPLKYLTVVAISMGMWVIATPVLLIVWHAGIKSLFIGKLIGFLVGIGIAGIWLVRVYAPRVNMEYLRKSLWLTLPTLPSTVAAWGLLQAPRYLLGLGAGVEEVGYYGVAVRFNYILALVGSAGLMAWAPFAMGIKGDAEAPRIMGRGVLAFVTVNVAVAIVVAAFSFEEVLLLLGADYRPAGRLIGPMLVSALMQNLGLMLFVQISISEKTYWQSIAFGLGLIAMLATSSILIPAFQSFGAVIGIVVGYGAATTVMFVVAQRLFPVDVNVARIGALVLVLAAVIVGAWWLEAAAATRWVAIAWKTVLAVGGWGACFVVLGRSELNRAADMVGEVLSRGGRT